MIFQKKILILSLLQSGGTEEKEKVKSQTEESKKMISSAMREGQNDAKL